MLESQEHGKTNKFRVQCYGSFVAELAGVIPTRKHAHGSTISQPLAYDDIRSYMQANMKCTGRKDKAEARQHQQAKRHALLLQ